MKEVVHAERDGARVVQERAGPAPGAADPLHDSPRMVAQRARIGAAYGPVGPVAQREGGLEDEEPLQARMAAVAQRQEAGFDEEEIPVQARAADPAMAPNETGMPNQLKAGIEALSGMDMSDVRVHRNSDKPAQLNALAYAQGNDIHLGAGQEQHLPHEAWHVVQQRQGRVQATVQMAGVGVNDDVGLESEADVMGGRAVSAQRMAQNPQDATSTVGDTVQRHVRQFVLINNIDVVNEAEYPKWVQNGKTYHITMISVDSMHVTEQTSRNHYHFSLSAGVVTSKRPKKGEVGGRFADHHTLDQLPDREVSDFVKNHITEIMKVK